MSPGRNLYDVYKAVTEKHGVGMDDWEDLEPGDRDAWRETARLVGAELSDEAKHLLGRDE